MPSGAVEESRACRRKELGAGERYANPERSGIPDNQRVPFDANAEHAQADVAAHPVSGLRADEGHPHDIAEQPRAPGVRIDCGHRFVHPTTGATKVPGKTRASASAYRLTPPTLRKRVPVPRDISWIFRKRRAPDAGADRPADAQLIAVSGDKR